jgi:hypothetical protein
MVTLREDLIHFAIRKFLKGKGWQLIAGQYPNGSDDELPPLNIVDPVLARDDSPDCRRHSKNKVVPDVVSCKLATMLFIEAKPRYSIEDEKKLVDLLSQRKEHVEMALQDICKTRGIVLPVQINELVFIPCLGFSYGSDFRRNSKFCYFLVKDVDSVAFIGNAHVKCL